MVVLVTGHLGYIGTVLTPMLIEEGHEVFGLDSDLYRNCTFGTNPVDVPTIYKDIRDIEPEDLNGFDAVIHLAGLSNDPLGDLNPKLTMEINYRASVRLAALAKQAGVARFIYSSTCSVYGAGGEDMLTEQSSLNPVTAYAESKMRAEKEISMLAGRDFSTTFLRNATAYGVSPRLRFDLVLNNLVAWAHTTGEIRMKSDGMPWRPIVHIEDISRAFCTVLQAPRQRIHNEVFNVARIGENYRIRELAEIVGEVMPEARITFAEGASPDARCYKVNCNKIVQSLPQFKPVWTARMGAQQLLDAYRTYGITLDEFEGPKYKRIAHIQQLLSEGLLDETLRFRQIKPTPTARGAAKAKSSSSEQASEQTERSNHDQLT